MIVSFLWFNFCDYAFSKQSKQQQKEKFLAAGFY